MGNQSPFLLLDFSAPGHQFVPDYQYPATPAEFKHLRAMKDAQLKEIVTYREKGEITTTKLKGYELKYADGQITRHGVFDGVITDSVKLGKMVNEIRMSMHFELG
jgi:hypothetical protein